MRPRHKAAENEVLRTNHGIEEEASMRPRHKAAENELHDRGDAGIGRCFNEAAA